MEHVDHFSRKAIKWRTQKWLTAAYADAKMKQAKCKVETSPAHEKMWRGIAIEYARELRTRRLLRAKTNRT